MQSILDAFRDDYDKLLGLFLPSAAASAVSAVGQGTTTDDGLELSGTTAQLVAATDATPAQSRGNSSNITFTAFLQCFKALRFSAILCGHRNDNSLREFFELVTRFLLERIVEVYEAEVRISSFYLLYALWFVQSKSHQPMQLQIRVNRELFTHLKSLVKYAQANQHLDLVLAYRKLIRANAFTFVECLDQLGPYYKTYLSRRALAMPVDSADSVTTSNSLELLKSDKDNYVDTLKELNLSHLLNCDKLESYLDNLESN